MISKTNLPLKIIILTVILDSVGIGIMIPVLPNLMTHCNNSTTAPSFDCIKYTPKNPTIMIRPPHMVKKGTGGKRYDLVFYNHYEPTPLTNEQFPIYDVAKQRQNSL